MRMVKTLMLLIAALSIKMHAQSVGGTTTGGKSYCDVALCSGFIGLSGQTGNVVMWQSSIDNGVTWTNISNTFNSQSYFALPQTTCYRAVVQNGAFPADTSTVTCIIMYQPTVGGTVNSDSLFCGSSASGTLSLTGNIGSVLNWSYSTDGGSTWTDIADTNTTYNYSGITQATLFQVVVRNDKSDTICLIDTSSFATISLQPNSDAGSLSLAGSDTVCYLVNNGSMTVTGITGNVIDWIYSTDNGATWTENFNLNATQTFANLTQTTQYATIVQNAPCPSDTSNSVTINVLPPPAPVYAGADTTIDLGLSDTLVGTGTGTPFWIPVTGLSNPDSFVTVATPTVTTSYILTVIDANSCINADTVIITVNIPKFQGQVSNYFSPNGDGVNDNWFIQDIEYFSTSHVEVYNIYGQKVYSKDGYMNDWKGTYNGSDLPDGTYYYILSFSDTDLVLRGSVDIMRKK